VRDGTNSSLSSLYDLWVGSYGNLGRIHGLFNRSDGDIRSR
jgi:hypothetical protein